MEKEREREREKKERKNRVLYERGMRRRRRDEEIARKEEGPDGGNREGEINQPVIIY